jgi:hypothetical protein
MVSAARTRLEEPSAAMSRFSTFAGSIPAAAADAGNRASAALVRERMQDLTR